MSTKIYDKIETVVNGTKLRVNQEFVKDFESKYNADTYSSKTNYGFSVLEFIFERYGIGFSRSYKHDTIFKFAPSIIIDWKRVCPDRGTASITKYTSTGLCTKDRDSTHYGFVSHEGNPFEIGSLLRFKLLDFREKDYVWDNQFKDFPKFFVYKPQEKKVTLDAF